MRALLLLLSACALSDSPTQAPPPATLTADIGVMHLGYPSHIRVHDAQPGETLYVIRANSITPGPCPPAMNGGCVDIGPAAFLLGTTVADSYGLAELELTPPTSLPHGANVALQVVALRGGAPVVSQPVLRTLTLNGDLGVEDLQPGDLAVTEVLADPTAVADSVGEWFELLNTTGQTVELQGLEVTDDGSNQFTLHESLVVEAGGRVVFGASTDRALNGGVFVDVDFGSTTLTNTSDELILSYAGVELDRVAWDDGATFPDLAGIAMQTDAADANEVGALWCAAEAVFGAGDLGSPGLPNLACPLPIDADGDGFAADQDCDDTNDAVNPGATEICDGIDNDCDAATTEDGLRSTVGNAIHLCPGEHDFDRRYTTDLHLIGIGDRDSVVITGNLELWRESAILPRRTFVIENLTVDGSLDVRESDLTVRNVVATGPGIGIIAEREANLVVEDSEVRDNGSYGVWIRSDSEFEIRTTTIIDNTSGGMSIYDSDGSIIDSAVLHNGFHNGGGNLAGGLTFGSYSDATLQISNTDFGTGATDNGSHDLRVEVALSPHTIEDTLGMGTSLTCYVRRNGPSGRQGYCQ